MISVVIPHLNQPEALAKCLESLVNGIRPPDQIIVVDNGSRDMPTRICQDFGAELLRESVPGPGPARNKGVRHASGDALAFIDADCRADPAWLSEAELALADEAARILGGDVRIDVANPDRLTELEAYESIYAYRMDRYIAQNGFTGTGNLVVRRPVIEDVGPFAGKGSAEDRDWGRRALAKGYDIRFVPSMRVYHPARSDFGALKVKWNRHVAHDYVDARDRSGGRLKFALKTLAMSFSPLAEIPNVLSSDRISGARARLLALRALLRIRLYRAFIMARVLVRRDPEALSEAWNAD